MASLPRMTGIFTMLCQTLLVTLMLTFAAADNATTDPVPTLPGYYNNSALTLTITPSEALRPLMSVTVFPLTAGAGLNGSEVVLNNTHPRGLMRLIDQNNYNITNDSNLIVYLSCDSVSDGFMNVTDAILNSIMAKKPTAIILYSIFDNYCALGGADLAFNSIFTMTSMYDAMQLQSRVATTNTTMSGAISFTEPSSSGTPSTDDPGTTSGSDSDTNNSAVAMSILYSITGLVTLLFLIIIATGAVRAHRHPERYGPRVGYAGRPGQSRAKGIARAVLETIPIVKFGDPSPVKGEPGHDLESMPREQQPRSSTEANEDAIRPEAGEQTNPPSEVATGLTTDTMTSATKAVEPSSGEETAGEEDDHPSCTICAEDFKLGEDVRVLPCNHQYHPACIDPWLVNVSGTCPLCRLDLRPRPTTESSDQVPTVTEGEESGTAPASEIVDESDAADRPRRRSRLDWNTLRHAPPHERVLALRELRERLEEERQQRQQRSDENSSEDPRRRLRLATRLRERFHIRTRTQASRQSPSHTNGEDESRAAGPPGATTS